MSRRDQRLRWGSGRKQSGLHLSLYGIWSIPPHDPVRPQGRTPDYRPQRVRFDRQRPFHFPSGVRGIADETLQNFGLPSLTHRRVFRPQAVEHGLAIHRFAALPAFGPQSPQPVLAEGDDGTRAAPTTKGVTKGFAGVGECARRHRRPDLRNPLSRARS